eukprot:395704_1
MPIIRKSNYSESRWPVSIDTISIKSVFARQEDARNAMESKIGRFEQEVFVSQAGASRSIDDILYKIQGDAVSKLKYHKMSAKRVIFIARMNDILVCQLRMSAKSHIAHRSSKVRGCNGCYWVDTPHLRQCLRIVTRVCWRRTRHRHEEKNTNVTACNDQNE